MADLPDLSSHPGHWLGPEVAQDSLWGADYREIDVDTIRDHLENGPGVLFLRGFPIEDRQKDAAREQFLDWCREIGTPVSQNETGAEVFDVADAGFGKNDPRTRGPNTSKKLSFHTDRCDVIAFLCWRQAVSGGENEIVSSMEIFTEIGKRRPDLLQVLLGLFPYKRHTVDLGNDTPLCEQPVFSFRDGYFACAFLRVLINRAHSDPALPNLSDQQIEALDFLEAVAAEPGRAYCFRQEPGDLLLLNNWTTLHRRSGFVDHDDPAEKRCLFRVWLSVPNSRPLDPAFAANFGSVEAGAVRGGMKPLT